MVKDALRESLSAGVAAKIGSEAERLVDGQVGLDNEHGRAHNLHFFENVTTTTVQHAVDASDGDLRALQRYV